MKFFSTDISHLASRTDVELVRAEIATLRAELTATKLEAAELYEKAHHMFSRTAKRVRDAEPVEVAPDLQPETDQVTARILARRNRHALPG